MPSIISSTGDLGPTASYQVFNDDGSGEVVSTVKSGAPRGELAALDNARNKHNLGTFRYPLDGLATTDAPHYVTFNINLPVSSKYGEVTDDPTPDDRSAAAQNFDILNNAGLKPSMGTPGSTQDLTVAGAAAGAVDAVVEGKTLGSAIKSAAGGAAGGAVVSQVNLKPKLKQIKTSISIYMPETITTQYDHDWSTVSLTEALGKIGIAASVGGDLKKVAGGIGDSISGLAYNLTGGLIGSPMVNNQTPQGAELESMAAEKLAGVGGAVRDLYLRTTGSAVNPLVEMVFRGTSNRQYIFEFDFQPRSKEEAQTIKDIIRAFRMFAAPELSSATNGRYFIPPGEFDIKFYFMNKENPVIAKISTCALTNIAVNYNASGPFATFSDGMPVHIHLALTFREIDIITRELIDKGGY